MINGLRPHQHAIYRNYPDYWLRFHAHYWEINLQTARVHLELLYGLEIEAQ